MSSVIKFTPTSNDQKLKPGRGKDANLFNEDKIANFNKDKAMLEQELQTALGEIAVISCPIDNCKIHYPRGNNANEKIKKAEHYVIERLANQPIKVVIKGLPVDTDVADIEADLLQKGFAIEKVVQLRKFSTKAPLPIFMVEVRRTEKAQDIYEVNSICYLCVTIDPFRRKPGATQCYNCNFFNHSSKNCKMNPRCLKCGKNHHTGECTIKEKIDKPICINCNEEGHVASLRSCPTFPKIKPKKGEPIPSQIAKIK
ncbi:PRE_C2HC domain-containing protein [Trichonephila clavipes]|nr:PRE_C2HC domain-containing protein [Trichonephila clavipes]